jgi:hypothetical protein
MKSHFLSQIFDRQHQRLHRDHSDQSDPEIIKIVSLHTYHHSTQEINSGKITNNNQETQINTA